MRIHELCPQPNWVLSVVADDGRIGEFDVRPYLELEAFECLRDLSEFQKVANGGYFVEWECGDGAHQPTNSCSCCSVIYVIMFHSSPLPCCGTA